MLADIKATFTHNHRFRCDRVRTLQRALWAAVHVIHRSADHWLDSYSQPKSCAELANLGHVVHDEVVLIDELLSMGCDVGFTTTGGDNLFEAIERIRHLIDWDECYTLDEWMKQAAEARSGKGRRRLEATKASSGTKAVGPRSTTPAQSDATVRTQTPAHDEPKIPAYEVAAS